MSLQIEADESPTPLSDYMARHRLTIYAVAKKLRLRDLTVRLHAFGLVAPSLGIAFLYQEELGIDVRHWARVPVVAAVTADPQRDPDAVPTKQRNYMRRRYQADPAFRGRVLSFSKQQQLRKIQMVKEGKAYYTYSPRGNPMIRIKPEFKRRQA